MTRTDRVRKYIEILRTHDLCNNSINWEILDELTDEELYDDNAISKRIAIIERCDSRLENNPNKYPERIMRNVRGRLGLAAYDDSRDSEINAMSPDEVLNSVCNWNGLINYGGTIKSWVMDIYGIDLDNQDGGKPHGK